MSFLKKILEPSEQDAFDHLTWTGNSCISIFEGLCPGEAVMGRVTAEDSCSAGISLALLSCKTLGLFY